MFAKGRDFSQTIQVLYVLHYELCVRVRRGWLGRTNRSAQFHIYYPLFCLRFFIAPLAALLSLFVFIPFCFYLLTVLLGVHIMSYSISRSTRNTSLFVLVDSDTGLESAQEFPLNEGAKHFKHASRFTSWVPRKIEVHVDAYDLRAKQQYDAYFKQH